MEIAAVKSALQWVLYTNQILLTDVFRYGNVYVQTTKTAGGFFDSPADSLVAVCVLVGFFYNPADILVAVCVPSSPASIKFNCFCVAS